MDESSGNEEVNSILAKNRNQNASQNSKFKHPLKKDINQNREIITSSNIILKQTKDQRDALLQTIFTTTIGGKSDFISNSQENDLVWLLAENSFQHFETPGGTESKVKSISLVNQSDTNHRNQKFSSAFSSLSENNDQDENFKNLLITSISKPQQLIPIISTNPSDDLMNIDTTSNQSNDESILNSLRRILFQVIHLQLFLKTHK
jgi:hypothetical protein